MSTSTQAPIETPPSVTPAAPGRRWFKKKRFILPLGFFALVIIISSMSNGGSSTVPTASNAVAPSAAAPAPAAVAPAPAPAPAPVSQAGDYDGTYGTFTAFTKTGQGATVIKLPSGAKAGIVTATHKGSSNFQISGMGADNQSTGDGLVNAIGNYSGTTAFGISGLGTAPVKFEVVADGRWTIKIAPISSAPLFPASATGHGDKVFKFEGPAADYAITHRGSANFMVSQHGGDLSSGVNEIGNYSGTVPFVAGPTVLTIEADGTWTFKRQN